MILKKHGYVNQINTVATIMVHWYNIPISHRGGVCMKKILLLATIIGLTNTANAQTEYYTSVKAGLGSTAMYVNNDTEFGDALAQSWEDAYGLTGFEYKSGGILWEISPSVGIDWTLNNSGWLHARLEGELGYNRYHETGKVKRNMEIFSETEINFDDIFLLINGYMDFKIDNAIPYIGIGIGHDWETVEITVDNLNESINDDGSIFALHLGMAYKYSYKTTFDFGVRRVYIPVENDESYVFTTARVGVRFRI